MNASSPLLILMSGPPGIGKSTLAFSLARKTGAMILDKDCVDEPFSPGDRGQHYTEVIEPKVLQCLLNLAELNLRVGHRVIIDVPWTHILLNSPKWQDSLDLLAATTKARRIVFELIVDEQTLRGRIQRRGLDRDQVKVASDEGWEQFRRTDRLGELNPLPHHRLDAAQPPAQILEQAEKIVEQCLRTVSGKKQL